MCNIWMSDVFAVADSKVFVKAKPRKNIFSYKIKKRRENRKKTEREQLVTLEEFSM